MQRRSFLSVLLAPFVRRFIPVKTELPVQSIPIMGSGKLTPFAFHACINDDLDALRDTPALFGRAAGDHWRRKIATLMDAGEVSMPLQFDPMGDRLRDLLDGGPISQDTQLPVFGEPVEYR